MTATTRERLRSGRWLADPGFGIYVHIPFCLRRCHYCDFNTYEGHDALFEPYVDALVRAIERWPGATCDATSVFFGGGTPTLLEARLLERVLGAVRAGVGVADDAEVTIECNPETVNETVFESLLAAGFNRFSIGVQSLAPDVLRGLGRTHSGERALEALGAARRAGAEDLNADLIYGSWWEQAQDWVRSLDGVIAAQPDHVSAYALTVEEGTPLHTRVATGRMPDVDPDVQAERHAVADDYLSGAGYERYETSNWCRPGRASAHNLLYWSAGDYLGFGAGSHAHLSGRRSWALRLPRDFISAVEDGRSTEDGFEVLDDDRRGPEALMLGLRLTSGIDVEHFSARFGSACLSDRASTVSDMVAAGLLEWEESSLKLSGRATMVANEVICRLL
jgi:oxygen-independent coproporphyrinogen III oxidase